MSISNLNISRKNVHPAIAPANCVKTFSTSGITSHFYVFDISIYCSSIIKGVGIFCPNCSFM